MMWAAAICAMAAVWFLFPSHSRLGRLSDTSPVSRRRASGFQALVIGCAALCVVGGFSFLVACFACAAMVGLTIVWLVRGNIQSKKAQQRMKQVARMAESMESWMALGLPPDVALARVGEENPWLESAVRTMRLGGQPWEALIPLSALPGSRGLARLARTWQVAHVSGASMAPTLAELRSQMEDEADHASVVAGELAGARATGRLMAVLPLVGLALGAAIGADPLAFFASLGGRICLMAGVGLACLGVVWSEKVARRVDLLDGPEGEDSLAIQVV
ncbi:MAG: type II secretion system F family protein [Propionibacteriaceae bacterium]|jgi:tight adherence protein B|nr:type II secretion system F family protein [Propionibacteriaceae bacterium]